MSTPIRPVIRKLRGLPASDGAGVRLTRVIGWQRRGHIRAAAGVLVSLGILTSYLFSVGPVYPLDQSGSLRHPLPALLIV